MTVGLGEKADAAVQFDVLLGLFLDREGIGAGSGWQAPDGDGTAMGIYESRRFDRLAYLGNFAVGEACEHLGCKCSRGRQSTAIWHQCEKRFQIHRLHNLKERIGGVAAQTAHFMTCVAERYAAFSAEVGDFLQSECAVDGIVEVLAVFVERKAGYAPEVVDAVGIVKWHAPARRRGRKGAEKEYPCILGYERRPRMSLYRLLLRLIGVCESCIDVHAIITSYGLLMLTYGAD